MNDLTVLYRDGVCRDNPLPAFIADVLRWDKSGVDPEVERLCATCPVRQTCLDWALGNDEHGVWAGTTRRQRESLARGIRRAKCPACESPRLWTTPTRQVCASCSLSWDASKEHSQSRHVRAPAVTAA